MDMDKTWMRKWEKNEQNVQYRHQQQHQQQEPTWKETIIYEMLSPPLCLFAVATTTRRWILNDDDMIHRCRVLTTIQLEGRSSHKSAQTSTSVETCAQTELNPILRYSMVGSGYTKRSKKMKYVLFLLHSMRAIKAALFILTDDERYMPKKDETHQARRDLAKDTRK